MRTLFAFIVSALLLSACAYQNRQETELVFDPDYNRLAKNVAVVSQSSRFVIYEYKDIRVDELAAIAAQYCQDHGDKQASLYDITLHRNNSRRATFVCKKLSSN